MQNQKLSPAVLRKRKFLLVLPLLTLPFITLFCRSLGIIGDGKQPAATVITSKGVNTTLPEPHLKDSVATDKMAYYDADSKDSLRRKEHGRDSVPVSLTAIHDTNVQKADRKLNELNHMLASGTLTNGALPGGTLTNRPVTGMPIVRPLMGDYVHEGVPDEKLDRMERMMKEMKGEGTANPEMQELNEVLDKLMAVQHPEQVKAGGSARDRGGQQESSSRITAEADSVLISILSHDGIEPSMRTGGFYGLVGELNTQPVPSAISAFIPETQTLVSGSVIRLQLTGSVTINGVNIPAGTNVYGVAVLKNDRLEATIKSLQLGGQIFSINLEVYDEDGQEGIYMPGAITRDMAKQSADQSINSLNTGSLDPSLGAQAGSAGIQLAKGLLSKKVKLVRVTVKAGYRVWLKDISKH